MNRAPMLVLIFACAAAIGHIALVLGTPHALMHVAMKRISQDGALVNRFYFGPRTTERSRGVVRPSPDLAYSSCVYDLVQAPLLVEAGPTPGGGYVSVSVFAANSDNIAVFDSAGSPQGIRFVLARPGQAVPAGLPVVRSPSDRGIVLDRRLAPTAEQFALVDQARRQDRCAPITAARGG